MEQRLENDSAAGISSEIPAAQKQLILRFIFYKPSFFLIAVSSRCIASLLR
jgi:hypothetical protein